MSTSASIENHHSSQFDEFWKTYYSVSNWNNQHQIAYWRSQAKALEYENYKLQEYIKMLLDEDHGKNHHSNKSKRKRKSRLPNKCRPGKKERKRRLKKKQLQERSCGKIASSAEGSESSYSLDEAMVEFLKQNVKFRQERDKEKEMMDAEDNARSPELPKKQQMENLFGSAAPKITAMEMAMQMKYDNMCDQEKPIQWPVC